MAIVYLPKDKQYYKLYVYTIGHWEKERKRCPIVS